MIETIEKTLDELFGLLNETKKTPTKDLISKIKEECVNEIRDGLATKECTTCDSYEHATEHVENDVLKKLLETSSSRILVNYYAKHKKEYKKNEKDIFLTFLLTNKIKRELDK